jgi:hypothetical protein
MAKACQFEYLLELWRPRWGYEEEGKVYCGYSFCRWSTGDWHLCDANNVKAKAHEPIWDVLCRSGERKVPYHSLYRFLGFGLTIPVSALVSQYGLICFWPCGSFQMLNPKRSLLYNCCRS